MIEKTNFDYKTTTFAEIIKDFERGGNHHLRMSKDTKGENTIYTSSKWSMTFFKGLFNGDLISNRNTKRLQAFDAIKHVISREYSSEMAEEALKDVGCTNSIHVRDLRELQSKLLRLQEIRTQEKSNLGDLKNSDLDRPAAKSQIEHEKFNPYGATSAAQKDFEQVKNQLASESFLPENDHSRDSEILSLLKKGIDKETIIKSISSEIQRTIGLADDLYLKLEHEAVKNKNLDIHVLRDIVALYKSHEGIFCSEKYVNSEHNSCLNMLNAKGVLKTESPGSPVKFFASLAMIEKYLWPPGGISGDGISDYKARNLSQVVTSESVSMQVKHEILEQAKAVDLEQKFSFLGEEAKILFKNYSHQKLDLENHHLSVQLASLAKGDATQNFKDNVSSKIIELSRKHLNMDSSRGISGPSEADRKELNQLSKQMAFGLQRFMLPMVMGKVGKQVEANNLYDDWPGAADFKRYNANPYSKEQEKLWTFHQSYAGDSPKDCMYTTRDFYEFAAGKNQQLVGMAYAREGALLPRSQGRNSSWSHLEWQVAEYNKYCNALEHFRLAGNTAKMTNKSVGGASIEQFPEFQGATPEFFEFLYASALRSRLVAAADYSRPDLAGDINPKDIDKNAAENLQGSVSSVEGWRKLIPSPQCDNFDPVDTLFKDLQNPQGALSESLALGQHEFREVDHPEWWRFGGEKCLHDKQIRNQLGSFQSTEKLSAVDKHTYERKEKCLYKLSDEFLGKFEKGQMNKGDFGLLLPTLKLLSDACTSSNESKSGESRGPTENFRAYKRIEFHPENLKGIMKDLTDFCSNV